MIKCTTIDEIESAINTWIKDADVLCGMVDDGIGPYEYGGAKGVDHSLVFDIENPEIDIEIDITDLKRVDFENEPIENDKDLIEILEYTELNFKYVNDYTLTPVVKFSIENRNTLLVTGNFERKE